MKESEYAVVIGGANIDIHGAPAATLNMGDSNPGTVRLSPGGVGRNIAENMARRYIELTISAGEVIEIDEFGSVTDNCINIVITVLSRLGVSDLAAVKAVGDSVHVIIDEESCYLSRDALGDLEQAFPQVCLYPKFLEAVLAEFLPECHKGKIAAGGTGSVDKDAGACNIVFEITE